MLVDTTIMMKKFSIILVLCSSFSFAQYSIKGNLKPVDKYNWVLLYRVEGAKQTFIKNAALTRESQNIDGKTVEVGSFEFELPEDQEKGVYRITYDLQNSGFADVLFNKEDVDFTINLNSPQIGLTIHSSKENALYQDYSNIISSLQYKIDSLQITYLRTPSENVKIQYKQALKKLNTTQINYEKKAENTFAFDFIKASKRFNTPNPNSSYDQYLKNTIDHFYDYIDFNSESLLNSSFIVDRIADYVFYLNFAQSKKERQLYYKRAADYSLSKINTMVFKSDVIQFLITQFAALQNSEVVDYLLSKHYNSLPEKYKEEGFEEKIQNQLVTAIGKVAPDFTWEENGKTLKLSELSDGQNYLLIFYSTGCSHCLREVPQVYEFIKGKDKTKVIAFAMEESDDVWKNYHKQFPGWYHPLGLGKWDNKTARIYQINSTPTYFVLGTDKRIIAKPDKLEDLKKVVNSLY